MFSIYLSSLILNKTSIGENQDELEKIYKQFIESQAMNRW